MIVIRPREYLINPAFCSMPAATLTPGDERYPAPRPTSFG